MKVPSLSFGLVSGSSMNRAGFSRFRKMEAKVRNGFDAFGPGLGQMGFYSPGTLRGVWGGESFLASWAHPGIWVGWGRGSLLSPAWEARCPGSIYWDAG